MNRSPSNQQGAISLIFFLLFITANAQYPQGFYLPFGLVYGHETVKDNSLSPVSYSGSLAGLSLGFYSQKNKWISQLDISGLGGFQYPDLESETTARQTTTAFARTHYSLSRKIKDWYRFRLFAGILTHNQWDYRLHNRYGNSQENFAGLFSLGPIFTLQHPFTLWEKSFTLQYQVGLPVGTYYLRPGFVKPLTNEKVGSKGVAWWGDYYSLHSRTDLVWTFKTGNQLRLQYTWDYAQLDVLNKVQLGGHQLAISSVFKF